VPHGKGRTAVAPSLRSATVVGRLMEQGREPTSTFVRGSNGRSVLQWHNVDPVIMTLYALRLRFESHLKGIKQQVSGWIRGSAEVPINSFKVNTSLRLVSTKSKASQKSQTGVCTKSIKPL
jgi:hypothetical protein